MCVFCGASLPVSSNHNKYEEHLQHWHNITIYEEVETAMARSHVRETVKEAGIHGEKEDVIELQQLKQIIIHEDTAADGEDIVTDQEKIVEDSIDRTNTVADKVDDKLEGKRKDREEELKKWKTKEDENTIEWKKEKTDMVQLRKTVEELEEEIRKPRFMRNEVNKMWKEVVLKKVQELNYLTKKLEEESIETKEELKRKEKRNGS